MARNGLPLLLCALWCATPAASTAWQDDGKAPDKITNLLAVNRARDLGRAALKRGEYQSAVNLLEAELPRVGNDHDYQVALRDAYQALIEQLRRERRTDEIATYQRRLDQLLGNPQVEPGSATAVLPPPPPASVMPPAPVTQTPPAPPVVTAPPAAPPTSPPAGTNTPGVLVRGVAPEEVDPFSPANSKQAQKAREFLARAEREFTAGHFAAANGLYDQAFRADESALSEARVRWTYCRLYQVNEALKRSSPPPASELEQEVRSALSLTPGPSPLSKFGEDLLQLIQKQASPVATTTPPVPMQHVPRTQTMAWAIVNTPNFRVYHNLDPTIAAQAAQAAEAARSAALRKWFGDEGAPWDPRCELYLWSTGDAYARSTGQSAECPGHSSVGQSGERIHSRKIDIHIDAANWMNGVLPHETTHVVIAGRFGPRPVPRWADEGMAVLSEPRDLVQRHLRNLPQHRQDQQLFTFRELLNMDDYPKPRQIGAFYAQSVSVVDYLSRQPGGPQKFSKFLRDGIREGYDVSLKRYYGLNSLQDLEGYWTRYAFPQAVASGTP